LIRKDIKYAYTSIAVRKKMGRRKMKNRLSIAVYSDNNPVAAKKHFSAEEPTAC
jgi:hypothetical protein